MLPVEWFQLSRTTSCRRRPPARHPRRRSPSPARPSCTPAAYPPRPAGLLGGTWPRPSRTDSRSTWVCLYETSSGLSSKRRGTRLHGNNPPASVLRRCSLSAKVHDAQSPSGLTKCETAPPDHPGKMIFFAYSVATVTTILLRASAATLPLFAINRLTFDAATSVLGVSVERSSRLFFRVSRSSSDRPSTSPANSFAAASLAEVHGKAVPHSEQCAGIALRLPTAVSQLSIT
jgi:hypothetical protein